MEERRDSAAATEAVAWDAAIAEAASRLELVLDAEARRALLDLTSRFLPGRPQPAASCDLLRQVAHYRSEKARVGEKTAIDRPFIERVFSIYSGLPLFIVSADASASEDELTAWFRERIVGQHEAIDAVVESLAVYKSGLHAPARPMGTFLFIGPTGVGKTELARALATFLFGGPARMLRFDMSEFQDPESIGILVGDTSTPAALLDAVRAQPFQLVLFDEIGKAHPIIRELVSEILETGAVTAPGGEKVDFRNCVIVCTSGAVVRDSPVRAIAAVTERDIRRDRLRLVVQRDLPPEFVDQFQHVAAFRALSRPEVQEVARKELDRVLKRDGLVRNHLTVEVDDAALDLAVRRGFDPRSGVRTLKQEIQSLLVMPLAQALMERTIVTGQIVRVTAHHERIVVLLVDTPESRAHRQLHKEPMRGIGLKWTREDLVERVNALATRLEAVALRAGEAFLRERVDDLTQPGHAPGLRSGEEAARLLRELEFARGALDLLARLRSDLEVLTKSAADPGNTDSPDTIAGRVTELEARLELTDLELVCMGQSERFDALLEIRPLGESGAAARDLLVRVYSGWARERGFAVELLYEPMEVEEPALLSVSGDYAFGFLRHEVGLHRLVREKAASAVKVRVAAWTGRRAPAGFLEEYALKREGLYGGKIRSRVECTGGLVLQNSRSLVENRELAVELVGSWMKAPPAPEDIVRRYEPDTPLVRDVLMDTALTDSEALAPARFHTLLCRRARRMWELREPPAPAA
jgi:hypothetical protein